MQKCTGQHSQHPDVTYVNTSSSTASDTWKNNEKALRFEYLLPLPKYDPCDGEVYT